MIFVIFVDIDVQSVFCIVSSLDVDISDILLLWMLLHVSAPVFIAGKVTDREVTLESFSCSLGKKNVARFLSISNFCVTENKTMV